MNSIFNRASDSDNETGSWSRWAHFVVNEVKRTAAGVDRLETEIRDISKEVGNVQNQITQLAASPHINVLQTQLQSLKDDISEIKMSVEECKKFRTESKVVFAVASFLFSVGITMIGFFAN